MMSGHGYVTHRTVRGPRQPKENIYVYKKNYDKVTKTVALCAVEEVEANKLRERTS